MNEQCLLQARFQGLNADWHFKPDVDLPLAREHCALKRALSLERGHCLLQEVTVPYGRAFSRSVREPRERPGERRKS